MKKTKKKQDTQKKRSSHKVRGVSPEAGRINRQAAAGSRRQAKDGNFHAPSGACATERALNPAHGRSSAKIILFHFMMEPRVK